MDTTIDTLFDAPAEPPADAHAQPAETRLAEQDPAEPVVEVRRSRRRTRTVSAYRDHATNAIIVLVPARLTRTQQDQWVRTMVDRVLTSERRRRPSDEQLLARANRLSARYLDGKAVPASVNWVDNQRSRWGSCTMADRTIRVSKRVRGLPGYVLDYVLLHEPPTSSCPRTTRHSGGCSRPIRTPTAPAGSWRASSRAAPSPRAASRPRRAPTAIPASLTRATDRFLTFSPFITACCSCGVHAWAARSRMVSGERRSRRHPGADGPATRTRSVEPAIDASMDEGGCDG